MKLKLAAGIAVFLISFGAHLYTSAPAVTEDDSGELSGCAATLGICHSPGYPLYSSIGKAVNTAVPLGNPAYRANLVASLFIAASSLALFYACASVSGSLWAGASLALVFSFCGSVWEMSNIKGQVYGPASFISCLLALLLTMPATPRLLMLVSFVYGIGITAHYNLGLLAPGLLWWAYANREGFFGGGNPGKLLAQCAFFFAAGLSLTLFIYIRAQRMPLFNWEDPRTLERFWHVVARSRYGALALAQGGAPPLAPAMIWNKLLFYSGTLASNLTWAGLLLLVPAVPWMFKDKTRGRAFFLLALFAGPGFLIMANAGLDTGSKELMDRFLYLSLAFACVIAARGLAAMPKALAPAAALIPAFLLVTNLHANSRREEFLFNDYARNLLRTAPLGSLLFFDRADEMEFDVAYMKYALGFRPDLRFVDCNASVSRSVYGDGYYRIWLKPRLEIRARVEKEMIASYKGPVYYATFDPDMVPIPRVQEGLLYRAKPAAAARPGFPYGEVYALRNPLDYGMKPDKRCASMLLSHYFLTGRYYLGAGNAAEARRYFDMAVAYDASDRWVYSIGFLFHQKGMPRQALEYYAKAAARGSADSTLYTNMGVLFEQGGDPEKAAAYYRRAIALSPGNQQAHYNLAVYFWKKQDWGGVITEFGEVLRINPDNREAASYLAAARERARR